MIDRKSLISVLKSLMPAVNFRELTSPAGCFCFRGGLVMTYNGYLGMWCDFECPFQGVVAAKPLLSFLESTRDEGVDFTENASGDLVIKSGRSRLTLAMMSVKMVAFDPKSLESNEVSIFEDANATQLFVSALEKVSISLGADTSHPERLGVVCSIGSDETILYSSDSTTLTEVVCFPSANKHVADNLALRLPAPFGNAILMNNKSDKCLDLFCSDSGLRASFTSGLCAFTPLALEPEPAKFTEMVEQYLSKIEGEFAIPVGLIECLQRALCLVVTDSFEASTKLIIEDKTLRVITNTVAGEVVDELELAVSCDPIEVITSAKLLQRALPYADTMMISDKCVALGGPENFCHLVAVRE